jgi:glutamyl-tRNA synthetase
MGKLAQPIRVAITGRAVSPGIFETLKVLGQPRSVGRIAEALHYVRHG